MHFKDIFFFSNPFRNFHIEEPYIFTYTGNNNRNEGKIMGILRAILCVLLPPLAVVDKGCGSFFIVLILTLIGWVPGIIGALIICIKKD
jgi:uncharacterized membrane protein YqaE (UPF0057 family)